MGNKFNLLVAVGISHSLLFAFVLVSSAPTDEGVDGPQYPQSLIHLGVLNGTSYFAEVNETMNRTAAAAFCDSLRLKLVSIETKSVADFLEMNLREAGYNSTAYYWTSAKESRLPSMFVWNNTALHVDSTAVDAWFFTPGEFYCIAFFLWVNADIVDFSVRSCSNNYRLICQS